MAFKLKVKRNTSAPATGALDAGELGYNTSSDVLYIGNGTGVAATEAITNSSTDQIKTGAFTTLGKLSGEYLALETLTGSSPTAGQLTYDSDSGTFRAGIYGDYVLDLGEKSVFFIENVSGSTIAKGAVVGFAGAAGDHLRGEAFTANSSANPNYIMGIADQSIPNNGFGFVVFFGKVRGIDTSAYAAGTILYASAATAGALTSTEPSAPNLKLPIVAVVSQNASSGIIQVRMKTGERIATLHDVNISSPSSGQILSYDGTKWTNTTQTHAISDVTNLQTTLDAKATAASPTFTGNATFDTNTLFVDSTNNRIGIGTTSPQYQVEIENTGANALLVLDRTDGAACFIEGQATRSAFGSVGATPLALAYNSLAVVTIGAGGAITVNPDGDGFTLPTIDGNANQFLQTDGGGNVTFASATVSDISDLTASAAELNTLDGITASTTELNYVDGVTSAIQTQLNSKLSTSGGTISGNLTVTGDFTINGSTTNINTTNLVVEDKNIILGDVTTPSDTTADGGGITLKGSTDKTITWVDSTDSWTFNQTIRHEGLNPSTGTNVDQLKSTTFTSALTTGWTDVTGVSGTYLATGSYIVQIESNGEYYTGNMSWFSGSTTTTTVDEIELHRAGPAASAARIYARVARVSSGTLKLQMSASTSLASHTMTLKFRRTI